MARPRITEEQRITDLFTEMEIGQQAALIAKLKEHHQFCQKRDKVIQRKTTEAAQKVLDEAKQQQLTLEVKNRMT